MRNNIYLNILKIVVLLLLILGAIYIAYINFDKDNNDKQNNSREEKVASKLNNDKEWVYDADYNLPTNKESYYAYGDHSKLISAKDLIVPYINIDTNDAKKVNQEIYKLYEDLITQFNENLTDEIWYTTTEYKVYTNDDIISVIITTESGGTSVPGYNYYTYNFNLKNGSLLTYEETYKHAKLNKKNIESKVTQAITKYMNKEFEYGDIEQYINASMDNYKNNVTDRKIKYFIDDNNKLNIITILSVPVESGSLCKIITIE